MLIIKISMVYREMLNLKRLTVISRGSINLLKQQSKTMIKILSLNYQLFL